MPTTEAKPHHVFLKTQANGDYVQIDHIFESYQEADSFCDALIDVFDAAGVDNFDVYEKEVGEE